jgi:hypothetical protein
MGRDPKKYPIEIQTWSRPELNDWVEIFWFVGRDPIENFMLLSQSCIEFLGRDRSRVATEIFFLDHDWIRWRSTGRWSPTLSMIFIPK